MAYKLKKSKKISEQIELEDGTIIDIDINVGKMSLDFNKEYNKVTRVQMLNPSVENLEKLGKAAIEFYAFVLGAENTEKLIEYYDDNYLEMIENIMPFINERVKPTMEAYIKAKNTAAKKYKKGKK